jgi:hypothetical protein
MAPVTSELFGSTAFSCAGCLPSDWLTDGVIAKDFPAIPTTVAGDCLHYITRLGSPYTGNPI